MSVQKSKQRYIYNDIGNKSNLHVHHAPIAF